MKIDFLKIYYSGVSVLEKVPFLDRLHHRISQFIVNWCRKHNFIRFDNLRNPASTNDDIRKCSAIWFSISGIFAILLFWSFSSLRGEPGEFISAFLFFFMFCIVPYAAGVINLEALKIVPKVDPEQIKREREIRYEKYRKIQQEKKEQQKSKTSLFWRVFSLIEIVFIFWVIYLMIAKPEQLKQWIIDHQFNSHIPIDDTIAMNTHIFYYLFFGIIGFKILLSKIFDLLFFLFGKKHNTREI